MAATTRPRTGSARPSPTWLQGPGVGAVYAPRTPGIIGLSEDQLCPAPDIRQGREVLLDAGFESDAIDALIETGAVRALAR
jgi:hypothetical protein